MLPALSGRLISEAYLEAHLAAIPPGDAERIAMEQARRGLQEWRRRCSSLGPASSLRAMLNAGADPLVALLGFDTTGDISAGPHAIGCSIRSGSRTVALLVTTWGDRLDPLWRTAVAAAIERSAPWCLLFNGTHLRLIDTARLFVRRHVEFDLDQVLDDAGSFAAFWTIARARSLVAASPDRPDTPLHRLVDLSDRHSAGVCRSLKDGVLAASSDVLSALVGRQNRARLAPEAAFEQALTIVYRMVFLLFAESRALVPVWHPVYRESYSLEALRATVERADGATGLWDALRAITRLAHAGCRAGDLRVTPFNGRLFAPSRTPLAEKKNLDDEAVRRAVLALSTRPSADATGRERIAYRDLGVEQLGAVYETLLDYQPHLAASPSNGRRVEVALKAGSGVRKSTGTFYTPQPIAEYLVRRALGPLVRDSEPGRILQLRIVDPAMGSGAILVAACRYLAAAYEAALVRAGGCHASDIGEPERAAIRRAIAERCLYGVDVNPMAVQLARLSLWLTTLAADRPLSFLDHRLQAGDSLLGTWIALLDRMPARRRRRGAPTQRQGLLFDEPGLRDALRTALPVRFSLESNPNDTVDQVRAKERALASINSRLSPITTWKRVADLWCASWLSSPDNGVPAVAFNALSDGLRGAPAVLPEETARRYLRISEEVARERRLFHWELEFPEAFFTPEGTRLANPGFDAVVGNPPWDMLRADPDDGRGRSPRVQLSRTVRFTRDAGVYTAQSDGHPNCYQLFLERAVSLTRAGGRLGLVLPSGFATDRGSATLRRFLLDRSAVDALVGFDNHRGVFPIHRSVRFVLLTATSGRPTSTIACRFGLDDPSQLEGVGDEPAAASAWFPVRLPAPLLQTLSGGDLTIPWLRSERDLVLVERAVALFPPLGSHEGWTARFGRELNATEDRNVFRAAGEGLPIVEGKHVAPFRVDVGSSRCSIGTRDAEARLGARHTRPRLAYRDVASATNRLTLIAARLPAGCVSVHTVFCLRTPLAQTDQHFLCGLFNSFVVNYLVRLQVTTHVTAALVERLPIPTRRHAPGAVRDIAALARLLGRRGDQRLLARLQARVARLYQLTADEFAHVLGTFPLVPQAERDAALAAFTTETLGTQR